MKRLVLAAVVVGLLVAGCAGGDPRPTTYISDTGATLNANVYTTFGGQVEYWWRYGTEDTYGSETPHRTIEIGGEDPYPATALPHAVSQPVAGLAADTTYHHQFCARDQQEDPPRTVCNTDRTFTTRPAGGTSGIAFTRDVGFFDSDVFTMDADGDNQTNVTNASDFDSDPAWSPDGTKLAFSTQRDGNQEVYSMDADGGHPVNLTNNSSSDRGPAWSPDGTRIAFTTGRDGNDEIYVMDVDGGNQTDLSNDSGVDYLPAWSPDGSKIAFGSFRDGDTDVFSMDADGGNQTNLTNSSGADYQPAWSPRP